MSVLLPGVSSSWCQIFLVAVPFLIAVPLPSDCALPGGHPLSSGCLLMAAPFLVAGQGRTLAHGGLRVYLGQPFSGCGSLIRHPQGQSWVCREGPLLLGTCSLHSGASNFLGSQESALYCSYSMGPDLWHLGIGAALCLSVCLSRVSLTLSSKNPLSVR